MLTRFGQWVIRYRIAIIIVWVTIMIPAAYGASQLHHRLRSEGSSPKQSENYKQEKFVQAHFEEQSLYSIVIVLDSEMKKIDDPEYQKTFQDIINLIQDDGASRPPLTYLTDSSLIDPTKRKTSIVVGLLATTYDGADETAARLRPKLKALVLPDGIKMYLTGGPFFTQDITEVSAKDGFKSEKRVIPLVMIVLILVFGGIVAACLPLLTGLISVTLTLGILYPLATILELTTLSQNITTMMGLGVGVDYSLLMVNRFREELNEKGYNSDVAAIRTINSAGRTILYSGLVVSIGLFALLIPNILFMHSLSMSGLMVVALTICVSLTLLPALLSLIGPYLDAPIILSQFMKNLWGNNRIWYRWAKYIMGRPYFFTFVSIGALICISLFTLEMKLWNTSISVMPKYLEARIGFEKMNEINPRYTYSPIMVTFETKDKTPIWQEKNIKQIYDFANAIKNQEPIVEMVGLVNPTSKLGLDEQMVLFQTIAGFGSMNNLKTFQPNLNFPFISADETKGIIIMFHDYKDFYNQTPVERGTADAKTMKSMRAYRTDFGHRFPDLNIMIGGLSGLSVEVESAIYEAVLLILVIIFLVTYILTMFSFGSVLLPLKAIFLNVLSVTATYGFLVLVFQYGFANTIFSLEEPPGALLVVSPIILFCIIFGLSMDYEIFLLNRIREEYEEHGDHEEAIAQGLEKTGGIITSAGLIMILVFFGFALSEIIVVKEFGLGLATAIFIDATIIRMMVVPAMMKLMGKSCWYFPKALDIPVINRFLRH